MDVLLGGNATLTTLLDKPEYQFIIWNFNNGDEQVHVATLTRSNLKVNAPYRDRVAIDGATGNLFLKETKSADSGDYSITVLTVNGDTTTAEIKLRVLGESARRLRDPDRGSWIAFCWGPGPRPGVRDHLPAGAFRLFATFLPTFGGHVLLRRARWCLITLTSFLNREFEFTEWFDRNLGHALETSVTDIPPPPALPSNRAT